jgi:hypothetical protein
MVFIKILIKVFVFVILTILTQIGGITYLLSLLIDFKWKKVFRFKKSILFVSFYLVATFLIVPFLAPIFGRELVINSQDIYPTSFITVLLNRNYVKPELNNLLLASSKELNKSNKDIKICYLDANFPFINGFPLLPHLSHNDGKKIDISLIYETAKGELSPLKKSRTGYGVFVEPSANEFNQTRVCKQRGYFQYDFPKYLTFGSVNSDLKFSTKGTKKLMLSFLHQPTLGKVFVEPHLKKRMKLKNGKIRFHGCGAVRHDDHMHVQLK